MSKTIVCTAALLGALALTGCDSTRQGQMLTTNPDIKLDLLFLHDTCAVYRFHADYDTVYFADCSQSATLSWHQDDGNGGGNPRKTTTVQQLIRTRHRTKDARKRFLERENRLSEQTYIRWRHCNAV